MAGSPCVVANLWDVTDRDVDRLSDAMLDRWGLFTVSKTKNQLKLPRVDGDPLDSLLDDVLGESDVDSELVLSLNQLSLKQPKSKKKVPAAKTAKKKDLPPSLAQAVNESRDSCILTYLTGAAPVVYGIPVHLSH